MQNKIKIRTMKNDLADVNNTANNNVSSIGDEKQKPVEKKQDQNKMNITPAKTSSSVVTPIAVPDKLKDEEISELKNLIGRISEDGDKEKIEIEKEKENIEKKDIVASTINKNIVNKEVANKQQKPVDLKKDEEKELKNLINKISETIDKKDDSEVEEKKEIKTEIKKTEEKKQSFWSDISKKLKNNEVAEPQRINALKEKDRLIAKSVEDIKSVKKEIIAERVVEKKAEKTIEKIETVENNNSGILIKEKLSEVKPEVEEKTEERGNNKKRFYNNSNNYQSPGDRLIFGKQKKYSSVSKRIKLKDKKDEIADLKNTDEMKEKQKIISEKEKYKKLKNRVIKKYNIKLFLLPWKKIIPIAFILIILTGVVSYFIFSNIEQPEPVPPVVIVSNELKEFSKIEKRIIIIKKDLEKFNNIETDALTIFNSDRNVKVIKLLVIDNEIDKNMLPLQETLDAIGIINIEEKINYFPENFLETTTNNYSLLIFKTERGTTRYGFALEVNDEYAMSEIMKKWEKEESRNKKMTTVLKPLFRSDKSFEDVDSLFSTAIYRGVEIKYVNLIEEEIALDYFIHNKILVFATSKNSAFLSVDLLVSAE